MINSYNENIEYFILYVYRFPETYSTTQNMEGTPVSVENIQKLKISKNIKLKLEAEEGGLT